MRMILDIFGQFLRTLWAYRLRSFLTMFGVCLGATAGTFDFRHQG